jgi:glycosyltransferase involved in cell wall biosynthesis
MSKVAPGEAGAAPKLLVFDTAWTLEMVRERSLEHSITCRDLGGFFDHVWSVHPFATLLTSDNWAPRYGRPVVSDLAPRSSFVEGKVGRFAWLRAVFPLNFLLAQLDLWLLLWRLIRKEKISVIRVGDPLYLGLFGWTLARVSGIPLVVRIGANYDELRQFTGKPVAPRLMFNQRTEKRVERFVFRRADLVAGANQDNLNFALANGARPDRSTLFRYGNLIDQRHFAEPAARGGGAALLSELGLAPKRFTITVSRLEAVAAVKHPEDVVRALASLRQRGHVIKSLIVGDGRLRQTLVELARELGVEDALVLAGNRDQGWLSEVLPLALACVSPHAGRALSEAALAGLPIVAYDVDWQRELIETAVTGFLVPYRDWQAMADSVHRIIEQPDLAKKLGANLRDRALRMLDPATLDEHEREEYRKLLSKPAGAD